MCKQCETKPVYEFTNQRKLCKNCFIRWFEKKFLYTIRKFEMLKRGDIVGYDKKDVVLGYLLEMYAEKGTVEIRRGGKVALADTSDSITIEVVDEVINAKLNLKNKQSVEGKIIRPLILFLDKEVELYAKLKKLKYTKKSEDNKFIKKLELKHPELKHAVVQSVLKLGFF